VMDRREVIAGLAGGVIGYLLGKVVTPRGDIDEYRGKVVLVSDSITLIPKAVYNNAMRWDAGTRYSTLYLYTTPQGDVNAVVDVSFYDVPGHRRYEAEVARVCNGELRVYVDDALRATFPATAPGVSAIGYYSHVWEVS